jgi:hypothetical protein
MYVFIHGDGIRPPPEIHFMFITPAAHLVNTEVPNGWVDTQNRPREFQLTFVHGRAEVDDEIGRYLIKNGLAQKSGVALFRASGF